MGWGSTSDTIAHGWGSYKDWPSGSGWASQMSVVYSQPYSSNELPPYSSSLPPPPPSHGTTATETFISTDTVTSTYRSVSKDIILSTEVSTDFITSTRTLPPNVYTTTLTTSLSGSISTVLSTVTQPGTTSIISHPVYITRTREETRTVTKPETLTQTIESTLTQPEPFTRTIESTLTQPEPFTRTIKSTLTQLQPFTETIENTLTQPETLTETTESIFTQPVPTIQTVFITTTIRSVDHVTETLIPVTSGSVTNALSPSYTISNVATGPPCASPAIQNYYDVQWYTYAPPSPGIPPLATHQPIVFPNNVTSTSIYCNTTVFEKYLRTQLFDCKLGRGPYQTLDCDCNIIVGPVFTGNGPTPTGPGITVTQRGPSGLILDLGTSISANYIPVTRPNGLAVCAKTTTTILSTPLIYTGPITFVQSFYRTALLEKRQSVSQGTKLVKLPGIKHSSDISPLTQPFGNLGSSPRSTLSLPGGGTSTIPQIPASKLPEMMSPSSKPPPANPTTSSTSTSTPKTSRTKSTTHETTSSSPPKTTNSPPSPSANPAPGSSTSAQSPNTSSPSAPGTSSRSVNTGLHTTEVCQVVTYTGETGFIVPELSIGANNSTVTETGLASELTAGIDSYVCSVVGGCESHGPTGSGASGSGSSRATTTGGASSSATAAAATGNALALRPSWWWLVVMSLGCLIL